MEASFNVYDFYSEIPLPDLYQMLEDNNHKISQLTVRIKHLNFIRSTLKVEIEKKENNLINSLELKETLIIIPEMDSDIENNIVKDFWTNPSQTMTDLDRRYGRKDGFSARIIDIAFKKQKTNISQIYYAEST